jgi:hypothetical protein
MEGPWEIAQADLQELVEASEVVLERETHRLGHEGHWRRWGSRRGRETLDSSCRREDARGSQAPA